MAHCKRDMKTVNSSLALLMCWVDTSMCLCTNHHSDCFFRLTKLCPPLPCNLSVTEDTCWILVGRHGYVAAEQIREEYEAAGQDCPDWFALTTHYPPSRSRSARLCYQKLTYMAFT